MNCSLRTRLPSMALWPAVLSLSWSMLAPLLWPGLSPFPRWLPFHLMHPSVLPAARVTSLSHTPSCPTLRGLASSLQRATRAQGTASCPGGSCLASCPTLPLCAMESHVPSAEPGACPASSASHMPPAPAQGRSLAPLPETPPWHRSSRVSSRLCPQAPGSIVSSVAPSTISKPGDTQEMSAGRVDVRSGVPG